MTVRHDIQPLINEFQQANGRGNTGYATMALLKMIELLVSRLDKLTAATASPPPFMPWPTMPTQTPPPVPITSQWTVPGYEAAVRSLFEPIAITEAPVSSDEVASDEVAAPAEDHDASDEEEAVAALSDEPAIIKRKRGRPAKNRSTT